MITRKLYFDADIWLNFWQREMLGLVPAFQRAELLLARIEREGWILVVSDLVKREVFKKGVLDEDFEEKISCLRKKGLVEDAVATPSDVEKAGELFNNKGIHFPMLSTQQSSFGLGPQSLHETLRTLERLEI